MYYASGENGVLSYTRDIKVCLVHTERVANSRAEPSAEGRSTGLVLTFLQSKPRWQV